MMKQEATLVWHSSIYSIPKVHMALFKKESVLAASMVILKTGKK